MRMGTVGGISLPSGQPECLVGRTRASIFKRVKGRAVQPCGTTNSLAIGGAVRPCEQRAVESELNADFAFHSLHGLARSANKWGELLVGIWCLVGVA
jgi:hypothetical protein